MLVCVYLKIDIGLYCNGIFFEDWEVVVVEVW